MPSSTTQGLLDFLGRVPSAYHAVDEIRKILIDNSYTELHEGAENARLTLGGKYFITRNYSSLIAFTLPKTAPIGYMISASHSDSPTFKIKNNPELPVGGHYVKLNIERYGGMLCAPWLDRPLSVAGKILVSDENGVSTKLVCVDKDLLIIPNVAIHMNRNANTGFEYKANVDMLPLFSDNADEAKFLNVIAEAAGVSPEDIVGTDLYLYVRDKGTCVGMNGEFISAPRLDDLECAYTSLMGLLGANAPDTHAQVYMLSDNEEVGSDTKQGAASGFLRDVLEMINSAYGDACNIPSMLANSFMLSCDNAHAMHPNHPEYADSSDKPVLNGGVVIKYGIRYATDSVGEALFRQICKRDNIPLQTYSNRPDMPGGSTLGNISNTKVAVNTVDIGLAQLAMHSCYETAGEKDCAAMVDAVRAFYNSTVKHTGNGCYTVGVIEK